MEAPPRLGPEHRPLPFPSPISGLPSGERGGGGGAHAGLSLQFCRALGSSPWEQGVPSQSVHSAQNAGAWTRES